MAAPAIEIPTAETGIGFRPQLQILTRDPLAEDVRRAVRTYKPTTPLARLVRRACLYLPPDLAAELLDSVMHSLVVQSTLHLKVIRGGTGAVEDYGIVSRKVITTAGVNRIVGYMTNANTGGEFKYHGIGTGTTAEATGDTALVTELTTEYNPDNTRATGTSVTGASSNIYKTVATNTLDAGTPAVTELGIFTQAANSGGTLLDRFKFSAINLVGANGDSIASTVNVTLAAGG